MSESLFPDLLPVAVPELEPVEKLSADRRRTLRQRKDVARGIHPLTGSRINSDQDATCGNCRFRDVLRYHNRSYGKCVWIPTSYDAARLESPRFMPPRVSHSASSDVRAWWPGCADHEWGDTRLSPDAMRSGPGGAA